MLLLKIDFSEPHERSSMAITARHANMSAWKLQAEKYGRFVTFELFFVSLAPGDYSHEAAHTIAE
jgi:hypothetical protein